MQRKIKIKMNKVATAREFLLLLIDLVIVAFAFTISFLLTQVYVLNTMLENEFIKGFFIALPIILLLSTISFWIFGVFKVVWRSARVLDYLKIICAVVIASIIFVLLDETLFHLLAKPGQEISPINGKVKVYPTYIIYSMMSIFLLCLSRGVYQGIYSAWNNRTLCKNKKRVLLIGAGRNGTRVLDEIMRNDSAYMPICILDDDRDKIGRIVNSVEVVGEIKNIKQVVLQYGIDVIMFAIPTMEFARRVMILKECNNTSCEVKVIPMMGEIIDKINLMHQMKNIEITDLLGRPQITFEDDGVKDYIHNKVIMVTGGGGSIGSELCRQIIQYKPSVLLLVDVYENTAYDIQQEIKAYMSKKIEFNVEIVSVTDYKKMEEIFKQYSPEIIFHAAAHKHVPLMETNPEEAVKNNVFGTYNVATLADKYHVEKFILISTDKAVNPTNVMGATKRCCEKILQVLSSTNTKTEFAAVRFGNVLGSNGSVIPLFKKQIEKGGPVTVTHKDIIRFFMTIPEAVSLVLQAGTYAKGGETFVLDMGEQVKIVKLAENLILSMGYTPYVDIDIKFTGLRPGEKLYEEVLMKGEGLIKTSNNKIFIGQKVDFNIDAFIIELEKMREICDSNDKFAIVEQLKKLVPTFHHDKAKFDKMMTKRHSNDSEKIA